MREKEKKMKKILKRIFKILSIIAALAAVLFVIFELKARESQFSYAEVKTSRGDTLVGTSYDGCFLFPSGLNSAKANPVYLEHLKTGETVAVHFHCTKCGNHTWQECQVPFSKVFSCDCEGKAQSFFSLTAGD